MIEPQVKGQPRQDAQTNEVWHGQPGDNNRVIVAEELFYDLDGPIIRVTTPHIPLPSADALEDAVMPSPARIVENVLKLAD